GGTEATEWVKLYNHKANSCWCDQQQVLQGKPKVVQGDGEAISVGHIDSNIFMLMPAQLTCDVYMIQSKPEGMTLVSHQEKVLQNESRSQNKRHRSHRLTSLEL
ncbi:hypothetical protein JOB18_020986, partial [Solea senegalensis]